MNNLFLLLLAIGLITNSALGQETATGVVTTEETLTLTGDIIDNICAQANKDNLAKFIKTHTKECALMPGSMDSGYSIFADGMLYKFDPDSNLKIMEFLNKEDSRPQVVVTAKKVGDELSLVSIENQQ